MCVCVNVICSALIPIIMEHQFLYKNVYYHGTAKQNGMELLLIGISSQMNWNNAQQIMHQLDISCTTKSKNLKTNNVFTDLKMEM